SHARCHSYTLCAPEFEHRLHIFAEKWRLNGQFLWQITLDDFLNFKKDFPQFFLVFLVLFQMKDVVLQYPDILSIHLNDSKAEDIGSRVDTQNPVKCLL